MTKDLIQNEWQELFENCTNLQSGENAKLHNLTIKIKGKNVQKRFCKLVANKLPTKREVANLAGQSIWDMRLHTNAGTTIINWDIRFKK